MSFQAPAGRAPPPIFVVKGNHKGQLTPFWGSPTFKNTPKMRLLDPMSNRKSPKRNSSVDKSLSKPKAALRGKAARNTQGREFSVLSASNCEHVAGPPWARDSSRSSNSDLNTRLGLSQGLLQVAQPGPVLQITSS